jgi:hypothetical protein
VVTLRHRVLGIYHTVVSKVSSSYAQSQRGGPYWPAKVRIVILSVTL